MRVDFKAFRLPVLGLAGLLAFGLGPARAATAHPTSPNDVEPVALSLEASALQVIEGETFKVAGRLGFAAPVDLTVELKLGGEVDGNDVTPINATLDFAKGQRVAAVALTVGTTVLLREAPKPVYAWVTAGPLCFVGGTTLTAGVRALFELYLPMTRVPATTTMGWINTVVTSILIVCVLGILAVAGRRWMHLLRERRLRPAVQPA